MYNVDVCTYHIWYGRDVPSTSSFAPPVREGLHFTHPNDNTLLRAKTYMRHNVNITKAMVAMVVVTVAVGYKWNSE